MRQMYSEKEQSSRIRRSHSSSTPSFKVQFQQWHDSASDHLPSSNTGFPTSYGRRVIHNEMDHKPDPFLSTIALPELHSSGLLDLDQPFINELPASVHPLFHAKNFTNLPSDAYTLLLPSLQLASQLVRQLHFLPFFFALLHPSRRRRIRSEELTAAYGRPCWRFDLKLGGISAEELEWTVRQLLALSKCVRWSFGQAKGYYGLTTQCADLPGLRRDTTGALVELSEEYLGVLTRYAAQTQTQTPGPDSIRPSLVDDPNGGELTEASILRTRFHLAKTIVHELCHAIKWATTPPQQTSDGSWEPPYEPFFMDQRIAEVGAAWESVVFGGIVNPLGEDVDARWGLGVEKWPRYWDDGTGLNRGPSRRTWVSVYGVPTPWIRSLWTERCWREIGRYGLEVFRIPKTIGVREIIQNKNFPDREWEEHLSDTDTSWSRRSERVRSLDRRMRWALCYDNVLEDRGYVGDWASEDSSVARVFTKGVWRAGDETSVVEEEEGVLDPMPPPPEHKVRRRSPSEPVLALSPPGAGPSTTPMRTTRMGSSKSKYAKGTPYGKR